VSHSILPWVCYRASRIIERVPVGDRHRVSLRFDAPEEARQFALAGGAELTVVAPAELRDAVIATAHAVVAAYGGAPPAGLTETLNGSSAGPAT
jgi:predicted DNA-binding transcriptional regulator YafY